MLLSWELAFGVLCPTAIGEQGLIPHSLLTSALSSKNKNLKASINE